ncbi:MAG: DNA internalization-related competence protein ComEC/Rec2 [Tatlockia sp.]|jgi:competence protein ComEC
MEILCFFTGIAFVFTKSAYPLLLLAILFFIRPWLSLLVWFFAAVLWGVGHQWIVRDIGMPNATLLPQVTLQGHIASIPFVSQSKTQFTFQVAYLDNKPVQSTILLSCYTHCPVFALGEEWLFQAKLKKPFNLGNPGGFDYVNYLKAHHIEWTGYIKKDPKKLGTAPNHSMLKWRERLASRLGQSGLDSETLGVIEALTLGVTTHISKTQWDLFRKTGTTHLMVISGSHIGLVAGIGYALMRWLWTRKSRLCLYLPAPKVASITGFLMAALYALMAGFGAPTQRALIACFALCLPYFWGKRLSLWQAWRYGLLLVLLYEPHSVLLPGFYLSFLAVAIIFLIQQRFGGSSLKKVILMQIGCIFGLMPLTLYWFSYGAINGVFANLIAIPLVSFILVPLSLIHLFLLQFFSWQVCVLPLEIAIKGLMYFLTFIDSFAWMNLTFSFAQPLVPLLLMGSLFFILFLPIRQLIPGAMVLMLSVLFPGAQRILPGDVRIRILDVGQGLAVVVHTAQHQLVYDTGVKFYQGGDIGKLALIPYFDTLHTKKIDMVVISHPDLDHRGGLPSLEEKYAINTLIVDKVNFYHRGQSCHGFPAWQWDGVSFRFLAIGALFRSKNNSSCVLQIESAAGKILLTGDIEKMAEDFLTKAYGNALQSAILLIPHHGSKTSSSKAFIRQVNPEYGVISYGFDNRYHFPHAKTINTLREQNVTVLNTVDCGMVSFDLRALDKRIYPSCFWNKR